MPDTAPTDLSDQLYGGSDRPLVLDVRHTEEFEDWHVPGSRNIDIYDELQDDPETAKAALAELPTDREVVTVCVAGIVADEATDLLTEMGYDATTLEDGMNGWGRLHRGAAVDTRIDGTLLQIARPGKGCLSYVLVSDGEAAVFDPSHYPGEYEARIDEHDAGLVGVFDTHAHADHVSGGRTLAARNDVPYHLHPADARGIDATPIADGQTITVGNVTVSVIHTPGHSPGGVTYAIAGEALLTGDTLFHESVGRVELGVEAGIENTDVEANAATLFDSLQRLRGIERDPLVLPAHDPGSPEPPVTARMSEVESRTDELRMDRDAVVERLAGDIPDHPPNFERVKRTNIGLESIDDDELSDLELGPNRCAAE